MDISVYIGELLYEYDCVIIPGFGGFICNYKPSEIHPVEHTITPPSKAISFNRNLKSNDGLLVNYISQRDGVSSYNANFIISNWVNSSQLLLKKQEELLLRGVGKLFNDIEGNLQFTPDESVNYLKSSFGLRTITAHPVLKGKTIEFTEKFKHETKHVSTPSSPWRIAAMILLVGAIGSILLLMQAGVEIKPLHLNEANVFGFVNNVFSPGNVEMTPVPMEVEKEMEVLPADNPVIVEDTPQPSDSYSSPTKYYIIVGAFLKEKNVESAKQRLEEKYPGSEILVEKGERLTRVGFAAGNTISEANEKLISAQAENSACWLMKK